MLASRLQHERMSAYRCRSTAAECERRQVEADRPHDALVRNLFPGVLNEPL